MDWILSFYLFSKKQTSDQKLYYEMPFYKGQHLLYVSFSKASLSNLF